MHLHFLISGAISVEYEGENDAVRNATSASLALEGHADQDGGRSTTSIVLALGRGHRITQTQGAAQSSKDDQVGGSLVFSCRQSSWSGHLRKL